MMNRTIVSPTPPFVISHTIARSDHNQTEEKAAKRCRKWVLQEVFPKMAID